MIEVIDQAKGIEQDEGTFPDDDQLKTDLAFWTITWIREDAVYPNASANIRLGMPVSLFTNGQPKFLTSFELTEANLEWLDRLGVKITKNKYDLLEDNRGFFPVKLDYLISQLAPNTEVATLDMSYPKIWQRLADLIQVPYRIRFINGGYARTIALDALVYPNTLVRQDLKTSNQVL